MGRRSGAAIIAVAFGLLASSACRQDMHDQPRYEPLEASTFFADGRASRLPVAGTVARGNLRDDPHLYAGKEDGRFVAAFPFPITMESMRRGRQRYDIFCSPCHDRLGAGRGMVVRRGLSQPPSLHIDRLRGVEAGYLYDVIANGFGRMSGYAAQISVKDRWAIVAYLRALQLSQHADLGDVPEKARSQLRGEGEAR